VQLYVIQCVFVCVRVCVCACVCVCVLCARAHAPGRELLCANALS